MDGASGQKRKASKSPEPRPSKKKDGKPPSRGQKYRKNIKPYERWDLKGKGPITEYSKVPAGWISEDYDLDEEDIQGNIERCKERIEDGIMPQWWETKLARYQEVKDRMDRMTAADPGLSLEVVVRLNHLDAIKKDLQKAGDKLEQLPNVEAIMDAYRAKKLAWTPGLVTYWSRGKKICDGPKKFDWKEFDQYSDGQKGQKGFWVEGIDFTLRVPNPAVHYSNGVKNGAGNGAVNGDGSGGSHGDESITWEFIDDTGSAIMVLYEEDLTRLENKSQQAARLMGYFTGVGVFGALTLASYKLEVTIRNDDGNNMVDWVPIQVAIKPGSRVGDNFRISGPWMRHRFFVGTSPNNTGMLYISRNKAGLVRELPAFPEDAVPNAPAEIAPTPNALKAYIFGHFLGPNLFTDRSTATGPIEGSESSGTWETVYTTTPLGPMRTQRPVEEGGDPEQHTTSYIGSGSAKTTPIGGGMIPPAAPVEPKGEASGPPSWSPFDGDGANDDAEMKDA
ncbi:uncharacterized protein N7459_001169 [Penicillium hispanicum]|uniref:uncharacterized protein n=1 Tax=Penicillium hispanicum TaxID=1080232 RepID=UPI002540AD1B|nr:uncharacterized protein N7459_001169 [Penicillium hispanicum]KAJ5594961.1 hypothetical protein N7459_001169 [Penicillium hispanicum]